MLLVRRGHFSEDMHTLENNQSFALAIIITHYVNPPNQRLFPAYSGSRELYCLPMFSPFCLSAEGTVLWRL